MEIEHAALAGTARASNDAERDDFRSTAAEGTAGAVEFVQAQTDITRRHTAREARRRSIEGYADLNATIGSTREARRAGTSAATSATAISNTAMAM